MSSRPIPCTLRPPRFVSDALARLHDAGFVAVIVGGAVRDTFLGKPIPDWDIATSAPGSRIRELFSDHKTYHLKHETLTVVLPKNRLEITPFRGCKRLIEEDLARRDFTINAMACDPVRKELFDPWDGRRDVAMRMIRATKNPEDRFQEDPIRLIRGIRLATELNFKLERNTRLMMKKWVHLLQREPPERIREEITKILLSPHPLKGFTLLFEQGMLPYIISELCEGKDLMQNEYHHYDVFDHTLETVERVPPILHLRIAALLHDVAKPRLRSPGKNGWRFPGHAGESAVLARQIMARLRFSRVLTEKVVHLIEHHMVAYNPQWSSGAVRRLIGRVGMQNIHDLITLRKADLLAHGTSEKTALPLEELHTRIAEIIGKREATSLSQLAVNGHEVMEMLQLKPGPRVGHILRHLLDIVTESPSLNNPRDLRSLLKKGDLI
jgi:tRNA nucleotidyltransferase/poly(A) polymerase